MDEYKVDGHVSSYLPGEKKWKLVWSDEFDGTELDETKWNYRLYFWGKKSPTFSEDALVDGNSCLRLPLVVRDGVYRSAHLQTGSLTFDLPRDKDQLGFWPFGTKKPAGFLHKYGYYEIRCRLPRNDGWHAAFWLQAPGIGSHYDPKQCGVEVDIMENYRQHTENKMVCGIGYGGYGKESVWPGHFQVPFVETEDGWHTYAVDWSREGYIFYMDGQEVGRQMAPENPVSDVEEFILVSTECHGYNRIFGTDGDFAGMGDTWRGEPVEELLKAELPDEFVVDYVRVFDQVEE